MFMLYNVNLVDSLCRWDSLALILIESGADINVCVAPGAPTPLSLAQEMDAEGCAPPNTAAYAVIEASKRVE